jgi:hypothetical protein
MNHKDHEAHKEVFVAFVAFVVHPLCVLCDSPFYFLCGFVFRPEGLRGGDTRRQGNCS